MQKLTLRTTKEIISLISGREISCEEFMKACLEQTAEYDNLLGAFISIYDKEQLLSLAGAGDERRRKGIPLSPIDGLPVAVKDNIHATGLRTTCASRILENYYPPFDAAAVKSIKESGGIIIGKTNLDEFAMGSTGENSAFRSTRNPWDPGRVPGGSSGGSAVAVASGMVPFALGSDTGGSIRQPASFCGIVGMKPTYGLVSRYGLAAFASSLDQIGPMSGDVYGCALLMNIIGGYDRKDSTSLNTARTDYISSLGMSIKGKQIAVIPGLPDMGVSGKVQEEFSSAVKILLDLGAIIKEVPLSFIKYAISAYYFISTAEACSNLSRYDGVKYGYRSGKGSDYREMLFATRSYGFGKEVKKRILLGNFVLSSGYYDEYYMKAQKVRIYIRDELKKIFTSVDAIAMPTTPDIAFISGDSRRDPMKIYLSDVTTVTANLSGLPAVSVPCGLVDGMPVGLQLMGKPLGEDTLFCIASAFEAALNKRFTPDLGRICGIKE